MVQEKGSVKKKKAVKKKAVKKKAAKKKAVKKKAVVQEDLTEEEEISSVESFAQLKSVLPEKSEFSKVELYKDFNLVFMQDEVGMRVLAHIMNMGFVFESPLKYYRNPQQEIPTNKAIAALGKQELAQRIYDLATIPQAVPNQKQQKQEFTNKKGE